jgi:hypothetical protein
VPPPGNVEGGDSAVSSTHEAVKRIARISDLSRDHPSRVDGQRLSAQGWACACARRIECDNGGLWTKERRLAEIQNAVAHVASQQAPFCEEQANANEYVSDNFCSHRNAFSFSHAELILGSCGSGRAEEPSEKRPPPNSRSVVMCGVCTDDVRRWSSQARPNFHVVPRLIRD